MLVTVEISYGVDILCAVILAPLVVISLLPPSTKSCNPSYAFIEISRVFFNAIGDTVISIEDVEGKLPLVEN